MRPLSTINAELSEKTAKARDLQREAEDLKDRLETNPDDPGLNQRVKRVTAGISRVSDDIRALQSEGGDAAFEAFSSGQIIGEHGGPGAGVRTTPRRGKERLAPDESVSAWASTRGDNDGQLIDGVSTDEAWGAWFRGYAAGDWRDWRSMFKNQMGTTPDSDGGHLVPTPLSTSVIDLMRASTPIFAAGAQTVPMTSKTLDIARLAADVDATAWHAENGAITATKPTLEKVTFTARTLPVLVKASRELAEDAPNTGTVVAQSIAGAVGVELTRAALRGDGTSNSPTGILNQTGVTTTALGSAAADWSTLANAVRDVANENHRPNAYITVPRTVTALELQEDTTGQFIPPPPSVAELNRYTTTVIPTDGGAGTNETEIYVADWSRLLIGLRTQFRIEPLRERFADNGQVAWLAWLRVDVQLEHPKAFNVVTEVTN